MRTIRILPVALPVTLATMLLLAGCGPADDGAATTTAATDPGTRQFGDISFEPCSLASNGRTTEALCGTLQVPENRAEPGGRQIALDIAWLPAEDGNGTGDPVFFLAGGPGQAATEHAALVEMTLEEVNNQRGIILVDQRGTGGSNPLDCRDAGGERLAIDPSEVTDAQDMAEFARQCLAGLQGRADPRFYTTAAAVRDLEAVRAALGVDKINLFGVSYGTRVAQHYADRYPQHTRTVVLDGVAPNGLVVGGEFARTLEHALTLQSQHCQQLPACAKRYPGDMRKQLREVMARLEAAPVEVDYRDPRTGQPRHGTATADTLATLAFLFSYAPQTSALLPLVLDEAAHGRYGPLMSLVDLMSTQMAGSMNRGMQWSVICAEDAPRRDADDETGTAAAATVLGDEFDEIFFAACEVWPRGPVPDDFNEPFESTLPVLLLSGELDPVTPPRYGQRVLQGLPNGRHLVLDGQGHNVSYIGCMPELLGRFIETADAQALDTACLESLSYTPPFVNFNGWSP